MNSCCNYPTFKKIQLIIGWIFILQIFGSNCSAEEINTKESHWNGDVGLAFSYYQSDYMSRTLTASSDLSHKYGQHETVIESAFDNQTVMLPGSSNGISRFRYDANVKWKYFYEHSKYYSYLSPRSRHNDNGNYMAVQAIRMGGGREFSFEDLQLEISVESGVGYRYATMSDQTHIEEQLVLFSSKIVWDITPSLSLKFKVSHEQSALEKYRTTNLDIRNKLNEHFSLKTQITEKQTYPYDISVPNGELISSFGIDYEI